MDSTSTKILVLGIMAFATMSASAQKCKVTDKVDPFTKERTIFTESKMIFNRMTYKGDNWSLSIGFRLKNDTLAAIIDTGTSTYTMGLSVIQFLFSDSEVLALDKRMPDSVFGFQGQFSDMYHSLDYFVLTKENLERLASRKVTTLRMGEHSTREISEKDSQKINLIATCMLEIID